MHFQCWRGRVRSFRRLTAPACIVRTTEERDTHLGRCGPCWRSPKRTVDSLVGLRNRSLQPTALTHCYAVCVWNRQKWVVPQPETCRSPAGTGHGSREAAAARDARLCTEQDIPRGWGTPTSTHQPAHPQGTAHRAHLSDASGALPAGDVGMLEILILDFPACFSRPGARANGSGNYIGFSLFPLPSLYNLANLAIEIAKLSFATLRPNDRTIPAGGGKGPLGLKPQTLSFLALAYHVSSLAPPIRSPGHIAARSFQSIGHASSLSPFWYYCYGDTEYFCC